MKEGTVRTIEQNIVKQTLDTGKLQGQVLLLIGEFPIAKYSVSPPMWNAALEKYGINAYYQAINIRDEAGLEAVMMALKDDADYLGGNYGKPYKEPAFRIDKRIGHVNEFATQVEAINTMVHEADGDLVGDNTDGKAEVKNLQSLIPDFTGKSILMTGAGGGGQGVSAALLDAGVGRMVIANKDQERAQKLAARLKEFYPSADITAVKETDAPELVASGKFDLILNASSKGQADTAMGPYSSLWTAPHEAEEHTESWLSENLQITKDALERAYQANPETVVADVIYNPWRTPLLELAETQGFKVNNGRDMLVHQAALAFCLIFKDKIDSGEIVVDYDELVDVMTNAYLADMERRKNESSGN